MEKHIVKSCLLTIQIKDISIIFRKVKGILRQGITFEVLHFPAQKEIFLGKNLSWKIENVEDKP